MKGDVNKNETGYCKDHPPSHSRRHATAPYDTLTEILPYYLNDVFNRAPCMLSQQDPYLVRLIL